MTEAVADGLHTVRFPYLIASKDVPFYQLAATAIPGIVAIAEGQPKTADSKFVPIEITGTNITPNAIVLLTEAAYFLDGKSSALQKTGLGEEEIDAALEQALDSFIARKLPKPTPEIPDTA
ncbi:MAG: hypothetical protein M1405_00140 [Patescibacteria group bacterium]|nr:hypothetical protein [Patescibacteria group bacterium]